MINKYIKNYLDEKEGKEFRDRTRDLASWGKSMETASAEIARLIEHYWIYSEAFGYAGNLSGATMAEIEAAVNASTEAVAAILEKDGIYGKTDAMRAVSEDGEALRFATKEMKGDRELCTAAVAQDWRALKWASEEMKGDRELCMAAVAQNGQAVEYVS